MCIGGEEILLPGGRSSSLCGSWMFLFVSVSFSYCFISSFLPSFLTFVYETCDFFDDDDFGLKFLRGACGVCSRTEGAHFAAAAVAAAAAIGVGFG